jgi:hypothetical protein
MSEFRIPADDAYTAILGRAVYNFTYYEGIVVETLEKLCPGYLRRHSNEGPTSGHVARLFIETAEAVESSALAKCAATFDDLRKERDKLLHAHPYTVDGGLQQLHYRGGRHLATKWPTDEVGDLALKFDSASCELKDLFDRLWP